MKQLMACLSLMPLLLACGTDLPSAPLAVTEAYKTSETPPPGWARLYVLPPREHAFTGDFELAGWLAVGPSPDRTFAAGDVPQNGFAAFDVRPGKLFVQWRPIGRNDAIQAQYLVLLGGQTLAVRPVALDSGEEAHKVGAALVNVGRPGFERVNPAALGAMLAPRQLSAVPPIAGTIIRQAAGS
jgi:hypothetical protein